MTFDLMSLLQGFVIAIALNNALIGIVTSLFLKIFNSILKAFASAMELVFTAILSFLILGIPIYWNTILSVAIVSSAVIMYAQNPVRNSNVDKSSQSSPNKQTNGTNSKV
jgi:drug/metabolite transporter (DMT)-like permease